MFLIKGLLGRESGTEKHCIKIIFTNETKANRNEKITNVLRYLLVKL